MTHIILTAIFSILLLPALAMAFVPLFPTFWYLFTIASVFGVLDGFIHLTGSNVGILAGILVVSIAVDWSAGLLGAKFGGAAWKSLAYGALGGFIGFLLFPPFGTFVGLFVGVLMSELWRRKQGNQAVRAATGALLGTVVGMIINAALALSFIILFILFAMS